MFPTPAFESRFKSCLAKVPVECRMEREGSKRILALRPKNVQRFDELIRTSGLGNGYEWGHASHHDPPLQGEGDRARSAWWRGVALSG